MHDMTDALVAAWQLVLSGNSTLLGIVWLSLSISLTAVFFASCIGLPLGAALAIARFPGRNAAVVVMNALMGLPPVVVGLVVYLALSRSGPLGGSGCRGGGTGRAWRNDMRSSMVPGAIDGALMVSTSDFSI